MKIESRVYQLFLICTLLFSACNSRSDKPFVEQKNKTTTTEKPEEIPTINSSNARLLQGKWRHVDDKTNFLVFEGDHRKEIAAGMDEWDDETFVLSDHCLNSDSGMSGDPKEKDSYITCPESDACWYIMTLTETNLTLMYGGRGNILAYEKVK